MKQRMPRTDARGEEEVARAPRTRTSQPGRRRQRQPRMSAPLALRRRHQLRPHPLVELRRGENPERNSRLLQRGPLFVRFFRNLRSLVVPDVGIERGDQHQRRAHELVYALEVGRYTPHAVLCERDGRLREELDALEVVERDEGLCDVELKVRSRGSAQGHAHVVADNLSAHHHHRLALRGIDLSGHDRRPRLVLREVELAEARAGAAAEHPYVV
mmetsp:Transcript_7193/g.31714  ORF Transcript_7193/g.31714 Transcript_7193/m.31714 type:complete len:215 (-) Transcript_7193:1193-1837(-)